ncbi:helix-turn-helix domain-containing protein [Prevotella denticola]
MKDRIRQLMESQHMTQQTFSDFIGISSASLSSIFTGRTKPTLNTVEAIRSKFTKINLDWLMYGQGPMFKGQEADAAPATSGMGTVHSAGSEGALDFSSPTAPSHQDEVLSTMSSMEQSPRNPVRTEMKYIDKPQRRITEIRIFFDDQTWESFVPKK